MAYGTKATFEALRSAAFGAIGAGYTAIGAATSDYARIVGFYNSTDTDVLISLDGVTDHIRLATGSGQIFDMTSNKVKDDGLFIPIGTSFYVRRGAGAPSSGNVWVEVVAAAGGM